MLKTSRERGSLSLSVVLFLTVALDLNCNLNFEPSSLNMSSQGAANAGTIWNLFTIPVSRLAIIDIRVVCLPVFSGGSGAKPSEQIVLQIRASVTIPVPLAWHSNAYHKRLRDIFMSTYKTDQRFQMSLQGLGTDVWRVEGRIKLNKQCQLRSARKRFMGVLMDCHDDLHTSRNESDAFRNDIAKFLHVKPDNEPFPEVGDTHSSTRGLIHQAGREQGGAGERHAVGVPEEERGKTEGH